MQPFLQATLHMETMGRPLVHAVIPLIDNLTTKLEQWSKDESLHIAVRAGTLAGVRVLNKYYSKTDDSIIYRLAMRASHYSCLVQSNLVLVMHPRYKLDYFKQQRWESEWIDVVRKIARDHYNKFYKPIDQQAGTSSTVDILS